MKKAAWLIFFSLSALIGIGILFAGSHIKPTVKEVLPATIGVPQVNGLSIYINKERIKAGLNPLILNTKLDSSAQDKCTDMVAKDYWSHDAPSGAKWYVFVEKYVVFKTAGENLAYGFNTSKDTVMGWMDSPEHKANILNPAFNQEGFAICSSPDYVGTGPEIIVVQHFIN